MGSALLFRGPHPICFVRPAAKINLAMLVRRPGAIAGAAGTTAARRAVAPAFTVREKSAIATWSGGMRRRGARTEIATGYEFLSEVLLVRLRAADEPCWLVHKTATRRVAVRLWPGIADIVATVPEALAIVASAVRRATAKRLGTELGPLAS
jgi:hypothetical protein